MASTIVNKCPSCTHDLVVTRLGCPACSVQLEGEFGLPPLLQLPANDLEFVTEFVSVSGSLKAMAERRGLSYPTIRNRLDAIIEKLKDTGRHKDADERRHEILDAIAKGELTPKKAAKLLKEIGS